MSWGWALLIALAVVLFLGALGGIDKHLAQLADELGRIRRLYDSD